MNEPAAKTVTETIPFWVIVLLTYGSAITGIIYSFRQWRNWRQALKRKNDKNLQEG